MRRRPNIPPRVIDLSEPVYTGMPHWPTHPDPLITRVKRIASDGFDMSIIQNMTVHTGTHVDAPSHFLRDGKPVGKLPLEKFMGEGIVLDFRYKKPAEEILAKDLLVYDKKIASGDVVLLCTGWSQKRGFNPEFLFNWPYVSDSAARFLVEKGIRAIGTDGLSIGGWGESLPHQGPTAKTPPSISHSIFLERDVVIIEEMNNLDKILELSKTGRAYVFYAPVFLTDSEASPCRAFALLGD